MYTHVTGSQSLIVQGKYLSMKYFVQLFVCMDVCMDVSFCLLCMHKMYMYICICMLSTVGTGVLTCSIIVIFFILNFKKMRTLPYVHQTWSLYVSTKREAYPYVHQTWILPCVQQTLILLCVHEVWSLRRAHQGWSLPCVWPARDIPCYHQAWNLPCVHQTWNYPMYFALSSPLYKRETSQVSNNHSSGAVWESRWPSWAVRPNEPSGFRGRKDLLNHASALVSVCP